MTTEISIPPQLQQKEFRFCLIHKWDAKGKNDIELGKVPIGKEWQKKGYKFDDKKLLSHIGSNKNYGCISGGGRLRIIDIDDKSLATKLRNKLNTLTIETGRKGIHIYITCDYDTNHVFRDGAGELRANNYMCVGPTARHPNGKPYKIINSSEVLDISEKELMKLIKSLLKPTDKVEEEKIDVDYIEAKVITFLPDELVHLIKTPFKNLTLELADKNFASRSERDLSVINSLLLHGFGRFIQFMFENYACGEKYREHSGKAAYLKETIRKGRIFTGVFNDIFKELEKLILKSSKLFLINKHESILSRVLEIDDWIIQSYLINLLSNRTFISRKDLHKKLIEVGEGVEPVNLIDMFDLCEMDNPPLEYVIENIITKNSFNLIGGHTENFKSLFALSLAESLVTKTPFLGKFNADESKQYKVLLYDLENSERDVSERLKYLVDKKKRTLLKNSKILTQFNKNNFEAELNRAKEFDVIVLDNYRQFIKGEENASDVTNRLFQNYFKPLKDMGKTIIVIHHFGKRKIEEFSSEDINAAFRGSSNITDQFDLVLALFRSNEFKDKVNRLTKFDVFVFFSKNRRGADVYPFSFGVEKDDKLKKTTLSFQEETKRPLSHKEQAHKIICEFLRLQKTPCSIDDIEENLKGSMSASGSSVRRYLGQLVTEFSVRRSPTDSGKYEIMPEKTDEDDIYVVKSSKKKPRSDTTFGKSQTKLKSNK